MRLPVALLGLCLASDAFAGGVGVLVTGGLRSDTVHFYDAGNNFAQYRQSQTLPSYGGGLELLLGDSDDRIIGLFRGYWLQDSAQKDPATLTQSVDPANVVANVREEPRNVGMATFGVQWGLVGTPDTFQLVALTSAGAGAITNDHSEFLALQVGAGANYAIGRNMTAFADIEYLGRHRKGWTHGSNFFTGVRYMFD